MLAYVEKSLFRRTHNLFKRLCAVQKSTQAPESVNDESFREEYDDLVDSEQEYSRLRMDTDRSLRIAIIGLPSVGKSTLINQLVERPVCPTASRFNVTRAKSNAIYSEENTQLVFVDTPGLVSKAEMRRFKLEESVRTDAKKAIGSVDIVGVVQDASNRYTRGRIHEHILELLKMTKVGVPSVLIMNKIDLMKQKRELLPLVKFLTGEGGWPNFSDVFMVSALTADGIIDLRNYFLDSAKSRDWEYEEKVITDQPLEKVIEQTVRAKLLDSLGNEIPYLLKVQMEHMNESDDGCVKCVMRVTCPNHRIAGLVRGTGAERIRVISQECEQTLSNAFRTAVRLTIHVSPSEFDNPKKKRRSF